MEFWKGILQKLAKQPLWALAIIFLVYILAIEYKAIYTALIARMENNFALLLTKNESYQIEAKNANAGLYMKMVEQYEARLKREAEILEMQKEYYEQALRECAQR